MARGDVVTVELPAPAESEGQEQMGLRPAVLVHCDRTIGAVPTAMVVPMTTNLSAANYPHTVMVDPSPENGLWKRCVMLVFQLRAIDKRRLRDTLGRLQQDDLQRLDAELRGLLSI